MKSPEQCKPQFNYELFGSDPWVSQSFMVVDNFIQPDLLEKFRLAGEKALTSGQFKAAEIGRGLQTQKQSQIRGDSICWVTPELCPEIVHFCQSLQQGLNESLYLSLKRFEMHWALYESKTGYDTHIDEHQTGWAIDRRFLSFVLYLNRNWQQQDKGELVLYPESSSPMTIQPIWGRLVLFRSDLVPHRVLPSLKPRWSLTGWFRR